jgi:outer membrane receptor protein involved in Fe transport
VIDEETGEILETQSGLIGSTRKFTTDGLYVQAIYGFAPKWTAGLRYDVLGLTNKVSGGEREDFDSSDRWTLDLTWDLSEFSRLRAQYAHSDILVSANERESFDAFYLQFLMSLGTHGAHVF